MFRESKLKSRFVTCKFREAVVGTEKTMKINKQLIRRKRRTLEKRQHKRELELIDYV